MKTKYLRVKFSNGETYNIPAEFIARNRAEYYVQKDREAGYVTSDNMKSDIEEEIRFAMSNEMELQDWAFNNMDWTDVREIAERIASSTSINYNREWGANTESKIITK